MLPLRSSTNVLRRALPCATNRLRGMGDGDHLRSALRWTFGPPLELACACRPGSQALPSFRSPLSLLPLLQRRKSWMAMAFSCVFLRISCNSPVRFLSFPVVSCRYNYPHSATLLRPRRRTEMPHLARCALGPGDQPYLGQPGRSLERPRAASHVLETLQPDPSSRACRTQDSRTPPCVLAWAKITLSESICRNWTATIRGSAV